MYETAGIARSEDNRWALYASILAAVEEAEQSVLSREGLTIEGLDYRVLTSDEPDERAPRSGAGCGGRDGGCGGA